MDFSIEITGLDEAIAQLNAVGSELVDAELEGMQQASFPIYYALADYPAERPGQKYVRTYALRESTYSNVYVTGSEVRYEAGQTDEAAYWVGHETDYQAWMHVGRWQTITQIMEKLLPVVIFKIQDYIDAMIRRIMG